MNVSFGSGLDGIYVMCRIFWLVRMFRYRIRLMLGQDSDEFSASSSDCES